MRRWLLGFGITVVAAGALTFNDPEVGPLLTAASSGPIQGAMEALRASF